MKTMWPEPRPLSVSAKCRESRIGARRLTSSARSSSSSLNVRILPEAGSAALLTTMSAWPASAMSRSTSARCERSAPRAVAEISAASGSRTSVRRPVMTSLAPFAARARAMACSIPPVAPVSRTVRPLMSMGRDDPRVDVIAIFGPTGVGKTAVAIALAERLRGRGEDPVAVSADALQVYRGLEVLTGAATAQERARLEHRLVGILDVGETFSAGAYARLAHAEIDALVAAGRRPIVVGGTGLYLRAALAELDLRPPVDPEIRARWSRRLAAEGPERLHAELAAREPAAAAGLRL